jgi:hypothetical protein
MLSRIALVLEVIVRAFDRIWATLTETKEPYRKPERNFGYLFIPTYNRRSPSFPRVRRISVAFKWWTASRLE